MPCDKTDILQNNNASTMSFVGLLKNYAFKKSLCRTGARASLMPITRVDHDILRQNFSHGKLEQNV